MKHLGHAAVGAAQLEFPMHEPAVDVHPVVDGAAVANLGGDVEEVLLVTALGHLGDDFLAVDVLLQRQQYLVGVHGLDEVVGDFGTDGLVHDVLFFALRHHHNGGGRRDFLDLLQRFQTREAGHHLVEQHQVEGLLPALVDGIGAVAHCCHIVTFLL